MSTVKVTTALVRNYGAYTAHFGIETTIEAERGTDVMAERDKHFSLLRAEILDFETNHLRDLPGRAKTSAPAKSIDQDKKGAGDTETEWVRAIGIVKEHKKGQDYFYIKTAKGTKWSTHGVSAYFDNLIGMTKLEYEKRADKAGEIVFPDDMYVLIKKQSGKPDRAIGIAHKDEIEVEA